MRAEREDALISSGTNPRRTFLRQMKILIADDHAMLRRGLREILALEFPEATFGEAGACEETLSLVATGRWDVLVLDVFMPGRSGFDVLRDVEQRWPKLPVLVLSSAPEEQMAMRALRAGAAGYLNKQAAPEELARAVRKIADGGRYVSARLVDKLAADLVHPSDRPHLRLSDREFQVMQMIVAGKSVKTIAFDLALSPKTVSTFHTRILEKLGVANDVELVRYALEHNLVESPVLPRTR
jgi:DNA-binding NarL/FixJ family response regulator